MAPKKSPSHKKLATKTFSSRDKEGDQISVGNITDSHGVAIGRGAQVKLQSGVGVKELTQSFLPIYQWTEAHSLPH